MSSVIVDAGPCGSAAASPEERGLSPSDTHRRGFGPSDRFPQPRPLQDDLDAPAERITAHVAVLLVLAQNRGQVFHVPGTWKT